MAKPQPRRVPSDDCVVPINGENYHTHEGEWVEVRVGLKLGDLQAFEGLARLQTDLAALEGEPDGYARQLGRVRELAQAAAPFLINRIAGWSWTDDDGAALPQPHDDAGVFERLYFQELQYLMLLVRDGGPAEQGEDLSVSPTTSSDTAPVLIQGG